MKKVFIRGPVFTQSGYGVHSRQIARWLVERNNIDLYVGALPWGITPWHLTPDAQNGLIGKLMNFSKPMEGQADVSFQVQLPNEWDPKIAKFNVGVTAAVETDRASPEWVNHCNAMDAIVVPSEHSAKSLTNAGEVKVPMYVIPESFHDSIALPDEALPECPLGETSTKHNFLVFGQITGTNPYNDRKNIFFTIRWLCEEFKDNPDVGIVLKTNTARNTKIDRERVFQMTTDLIKEVRVGEFPRIHVIHGSLTDEQVATIYRHPSVKALVAITRGEGYGLPILEAAVSGLPVIATPWSGHMDFMKHGRFIQVHYDLKEIHSSRIDNKIFVPGTRWAEASEADFKRRVRKFYDNSLKPNEWAAALKNKLLNMYGFEKIANIYEDTFKEQLT